MAFMSCETDLLPVSQGCQSYFSRDVDPLIKQQTKKHIYSHTGQADNKKYGENSKQETAGLELHTSRLSYVHVRQSVSESMGSSTRNEFIQYSESSQWMESI